MVRKRLSTLGWCHVVDGMTKILYSVRLHDLGGVHNKTYVTSLLVYLLLFSLFFFVILSPRKCYAPVIGAM